MPTSSQLLLRIQHIITNRNSCRKYKNNKTISISTMTFSILIWAKTVTLFYNEINLQKAELELNLSGLHSELMALYFTWSLEIHTELSGKMKGPYDRWMLQPFKMMTWLLVNQTPTLSCCQMVHRLSLTHRVQAEIYWRWFFYSFVPLRPH